MNPRGSNIMRCPHCGAVCKTVKTNQVTPIYREITYVCTDQACGHIFVAAMTPVRTLEPAAHPNPAVHIPFPAAGKAAG